ncbi:hypothetical protein BMS3Abin05_01255 [bacterium BMS3Abin05]|nr:hypothetical protein BMS3Abin05_01255 [bacterium BMS3Abin05]GBE28579.1 hypothetical protein BMS3Bbin03_02527 [bacterium BMS3Bbin03]HDL77976.1 hypothetical protein [Bacteroidota bacterium]HDZ10902.1 hypothetical protein [Bacteroidota bacterium]
MTHKKIIIYSLTLAVLLLFFTFSVVKRNSTVSEEPVARAKAAGAELSGQLILPGADTGLTEIQLQKIKPILLGASARFDQKWGRNPFQPFVYHPKRTIRRKKKAALRLEGILQKGTRRKAIINGKVVSVGDKIGIYRVKFILENLVALKSSEKEIYLRF